MKEIASGVAVERASLLVALCLLWLWLTRPNRAKRIEAWSDERLGLVCGLGVAMNLALVVALPLASNLSARAGVAAAATMRELASLAVAAPLMILALRACRRCRRVSPPV